MYDLFLKYFRDELISDKIMPIPLSKIREYQAFMEHNLPFTPLSRDSKRYYREALINAINDSRRLLILRTMKRILGAKESGEAPDNMMLEYMDKLLSFHTNLLVGVYIVSRNRILVKLKKNIRYNGSNLRTGDTLFMELEDSIILYLKEAIEPMIKPYFRELLEIKD